jgi:hypothetical protein
MARVVVALSVLALMLAGCGDDGGGEKSVSTPAPKSDAPAAEGTGYTLQPPGDFGDLSDKFEGSAIRVDLAYAEKGGGDGFATNLVVIRERPGGEFELEDAVDVFTKQAESQATDEGISEVEDRELDGVPAKSWAFQRRGEDNGRIRQRQVVAVKDGAIYTITWSVAADEFDAQEATLDEILASWRWT